jgi:hypothetical protein
MGITAEVVRAITAPLTILEIIATDAPDTLIISKALEQRLTIKKEINIGHTIVFEDDSFRFLIQKPADRLAHAVTATKIALAIEVLNLAGPINFALNNFSGCLDFLILARPGGVGAIAGDVHPLWRVSPYGLNDLPGGARTAPS